MQGRGKKNWVLLKTSADIVSYLTHKYIDNHPHFSLPTSKITGPLSYTYNKLNILEGQRSDGRRHPCVTLVSPLCHPCVTLASP